MSIIKFRRDYQLAPILLVGGIANRTAQNGTMTVLTLTEGSDSVNYPNESDYFAHFKPLPGGTLVDFSAAEYPFASMNMAANAMVQNALRFSMLMTCPPRTNPKNSYPSMQAIITRIRQQMTAHVLAGGVCTVATPATIYDNCLFLSLRDASSAGDKTVQNAFVWEFLQPLITQQAAEVVFNSLYNKLANGLPTSNPPTNSGVATATGSASTNQPSSSTNTNNSTTGTGPD